MQAYRMFRPMLTYKMGRSGGTLSIADRWYSSSQIHHDSGCRLRASHKLDKMLVCVETGDHVDRDINAAKNLRDWPELNASSDLVEASVPVDTQDRSQRCPGKDCGNTRCRGTTVRHLRNHLPVVVRRESSHARDEKPRKGKSHE